MYRCMMTGKLSRLGEPLHKITIATRQRAYTRWERNEETLQWEEVFVSLGWELLKELSVSAEGEAIWNSWSEEEKQSFLNHYYPHLVKEMMQAAAAARKIQTEKPAAKRSQ